MSSTIEPLEWVAAEIICIYEPGLHHFCLTHLGIHASDIGSKTNRAADMLPAWEYLDRKALIHNILAFVSERKSETIADEIIQETARQLGMST